MPGVYVVYHSDVNASGAGSRAYDWRRRNAGMSRGEDMSMLESSFSSDPRSADGSEIGSESSRPGRRLTVTGAGGSERVGDGGSATSSAAGDRDAATAAAAVRPRCAV